MKILFLSDNQQCYGSYYIYNGLCEILDEENVIIYPAKLSYLGLCDKYYTLDDGKRGMTWGGSYVKIRNFPIITLEEIFDQMQEFSFIILSAPRTYAVRALRFIKKYYQDRLPPIVYIDSEDSLDIKDEIIDEFKPAVVFKRELTKEKEGIYPLPFSSCVSYLDKTDQEKKLNIFASMGYTCGYRRIVIDFLIDTYGHEGNYFNIDIPSAIKEEPERYPHKMLPYYDYLQAIAESKIAVCVRGHGLDTVRYWEIPSFETLFMVKDPGIVIPHPFEDKKHCIYFEDIDDLKEKIDYYLEHDEERIAIAKAGKEHLMKYHTNKKRAEWFLEKIKEVLYG